MSWDGSGAHATNLRLGSTHRGFTHFVVGVRAYPIKHESPLLNGSDFEGEAPMTWSWELINLGEMIAQAMAGTLWAN